MSSRNGILINIDAQKIVDYYKNRVAELEEQVMQQKLSNEYLLSHINQLPPQELNRIGLHRADEKNEKRLSKKE